jgi:hypothetical protein
MRFLQGSDNATVKVGPWHHTDSILLGQIAKPVVTESTLFQLVFVLVPYFPSFI